MLRTMRGLITAYEPFRGRETNQSQLVLEGVLGNQALPSGWEGQTWPVNLPEVRRRVQEIMANPPRIWLALGEAGKSPQSRLETRAHNRFDLVHDCVAAGKESTAGLLDSHGPCALRSHWPAAQLTSALAAKNHRVRLSDDPGSHCCNALLYLANLEAQKKRLRPWIGFLHLPRLAAATGDQIRLIEEACLWLEGAAESYTLPPHNGLS